jgi:hypothetical protein
MMSFSEPVIQEGSSISPPAPKGVAGFTEPRRRIRRGAPGRNTAAGRGYRLHASGRLPGGRAGIADKYGGGIGHSGGAGEGLSHTAAVGVGALGVLGRRMSGRVEYAPLRQCGGGAAGRRLEQKKTQTGRFAFFSSLRPSATGRGLFLPL